jgi:hypothetical protein
MAETWKINGTYFEACSCDVACPVPFLVHPQMEIVLRLPDGILTMETFKALILTA